MTVFEVQEILDEMAKIAGFDAGPVASASIEKIRAAYNGCGPERWPQDLRDKLDEETAIFAPAVLVHDLEFTESDGSDEKLHEANERLHRNNKLIIRHYYPFWTAKMFKPSYRLARAKALGIMLVINTATSDKFTRKAWLEAYSRRSAETVTKQEG